VVHPYYRHRGIARGLLAYAEHAASVKSYRTMTIGVDEGNQYARAIYERRGYRWSRDLHAPWGRIHVLVRRLVAQTLAP
jgi:ribosomal protein S18 acetylase RimI-like enzyme